HVWGFTDNGKNLLWTGVRMDLLQRGHNAPQQVRADDIGNLVGAARWAACAAAFPELGQFRCRAYTSADLKEEAPRRFDILGEASGAAATPFGLSPDGSVLVESIMRLAGRPDTGMGTFWAPESMRLSDAFSGQEILRTKELGAMGPITFAPDSRSFVGPATAGLKIFETRTGKVRLQIKADVAAYGGCAFSPHRHPLAFINDKHPSEVCDATGGQAAATVAQDDPTVRLAFSPDGSLLASGGNPGTILLWDLSAALKRAFNEPAWTAADKDRLWSDLASADA